LWKNKRDDPRFSSNLRGTGLGFANLQVQDGKCGGKNGGEKERFLRGCAIGLAVYCVGFISDEGGVDVSRDQGFCQIISGRGIGLDR
jgi:hypothetical protein